MRIVITFWNNRVSPVFDVSGEAMLFNSEGVWVNSALHLVFPDICALDKVAYLTEARTNLLICGAISRDAHVAATNAGIKVYPFIAGDVRDVLQACLEGRLEEAVFAMPGCACRMARSERCTQGRGRKGITGSTFFYGQKPE